jgi:hypothetical protein
MRSCSIVSVGFVMWFLGIFLGVTMEWNNAKDRIETPVTWKGDPVSSPAWNTTLTQMLLLLSYAAFAIVDTQHKDKFSRVRSITFLVVSSLRCWHYSLVVGFTDVGYVVFSVMAGLFLGMLSYYAESRNGIYASIEEKAANQYDRIANDHRVAPIGLSAPPTADRPATPIPHEQDATELGSPVLGDPHQQPPVLGTGTFATIELHAPPHRNAGNSSAAVPVAPDDISVSSEANGSVPTHQIKDTHDIDCISSYSLMLLVCTIMYTAFCIAQIVYMPVNSAFPLAGYICTSTVLLMVMLDTLNVVTGYGSMYDMRRLTAGFGICTTFLAHYFLSDRS